MANNTEDVEAENLAKLNELCYPHLEGACGTCGINPRLIQQEINRQELELLDRLIGYGERGGHDVYCRTIGEAVLAERKKLKKGLSDDQ